MKAIKKVAGLPKVHIVFLSFLLNLLWETAQSRFFDFQYRFGSFALCMLYCASIDTLITIGLFGAVAFIYQKRAWFLNTTRAQVATLLTFSVLFNTFVEYFNVYIAKDWAYKSTMPVLFGIGLLPIIQGIIVPLLILFTIRTRLKRTKEVL